MLRATFAVAALLLLISPALAQSIRGSIGGVVTDASRRPLAGVTVRIVEDGTSRQRQTITDSQGEFLVPLVAPGIYHLEVESAGYRKHVQPLALDLNQELRVDVPMLAGK